MKFNILMYRIFTTITIFSFSLLNNIKRKFNKYNTSLISPYINAGSELLSQIYDDYTCYKSHKFNKSLVLNKLNRVNNKNIHVFIIKDDIKIDEICINKKYKYRLLNAILKNIEGMLEFSEENIKYEAKFNINIDLNLQEFEENDLKFYITIKLNEFKLYKIINKKGERKTVKIKKHNFLFFGNPEFKKYKKNLQNRILNEFNKSI